MARLFTTAGGETLIFAWRQEQARWGGFLVVQGMLARLFLLALLYAAAAARRGGGKDLPRCVGPIQSELRFGCTADRALAENICCQNRHYAEPSGYLAHAHVDLFGKLERGSVVADGTTTFYDAVCGIPLFVAPRGRSLAAWREESLEHGWPSFRAAEVVAENVVVDASDGEVRSACGLHLGHNIPDGGGDRYCIDLVCIAGAQGVGAQLAPTAALLIADEGARPASALPEAVREL